MKHESESAFRREPREAVASGNLCTRALTARTIASLRRYAAATDVAAELWPNDRALQQLLTRAASTPAMTTVVGWAAELVRRTVSDAITALGAASSAADVMAKSLLLDWNGGGIISAPGFVANAANSGFVAEGDPIPVRQLAAGPALLSPHKLATIGALTREMVESSNAEALISDALVRSSGLALDAVFFGTAAATAAGPAGIRNGIAPLPPSANADPFGSVFEDLTALIGAVSAVGGKGPFFIVGSAANVIGMNMRFDLDRGDPDTAIVPLMSGEIGGDLIAIAPKALVAALSADPDVETTNAATLVMDTAPGAAGTMGPEKEMFQSDSLAVKVRWPVSWALRDPRAVAWLTPTWK